MNLFGKKTSQNLRKKHKLRIRVFEEDYFSTYIRSKSFYPAGDADYDTICLLLERMGFRPTGKEEK